MPDVNSALLHVLPGEGVKKGVKRRVKKSVKKGVEKSVEQRGRVAEGAACFVAYGGSGLNATGAP
ncbi:MAG TPA: hypothetical protein VFP77_12600 [Gemmatimonadaceae bacterium]|nr:hypothetical protein [Gemmatimonadaceae bacterium]